jgi:hypothetical protein
MTDPEFVGQGQPAASAPATPWAPPTTPGPIPGFDPGMAQPPGTAAPRRRRWVWFTLAAVVVVLGLTAGLVAWAPWVPPPVLRPAGLVAGPATANSISFRWSRPPTGPLPDKYLILGIGAPAGSVAGTITSYRQTGLTPATTYQYHVVAVRAGKRSPQSTVLTVRTLTPPISQARLQGPWNIGLRYHHRIFGVRHETLLGEIIPVCTARACDVTLHVTSRRDRFRVKLARAGAVYRGQTVVGFIRCGTSSNWIPDPTTLKFRIRVTSAVGEDQVWAATAFAGTMTGTAQYVSAAAFYCPAQSFKATLSGSPD